jgi:hypothetical protein
MLSNSKDLGIQATKRMERKRFTARVEEGADGSAIVRLPFSPDALWGKKPRHRVSGTVDGQKIRAILAGGKPVLILTRMWRRDCGVKVGKRATIELWPEGPQQTDLAEDFLRALKKEPKALSFFDDLAQFYRKAYVRWIDATKRKPEERARRIKEVVKLLKAGVKERPR